MYPVRVLVTLVSLIVAVAAFVFAVILTGNVSVETSPLIVSVLGFVGLIVNSIVNGQKIRESVEETSAKVDRVLNGEMESKVAAAVRRQLFVYFTGEEPPSTYEDDLS